MVRRQHGALPRFIAEDDCYAESTMLKSRSLGVMSGLLALLALARPAVACSYAEPEPELRGVPSDGQEDVPTDVVPEQPQRC
jgi:hypothetical protein